MGKSRQGWLQPFTYGHLFGSFARRHWGSAGIVPVGCRGRFLSVTAGVELAGRPLGRAAVLRLFGQGLCLYRTLGGHVLPLPVKKIICYQ